MYIIYWDPWTETDRPCWILILRWGRSWLVGAAPYTSIDSIGCLKQAQCQVGMYMGTRGTRSGAGRGLLSRVLSVTRYPLPHTQVDTSLDWLLRQATDDLDDLTLTTLHPHCISPQAHSNLCLFHQTFKLSHSLWSQVELLHIIHAYMHHSFTNSIFHWSRKMM